MEPPTVRVNTFVKAFHNSIDWISKVFVLSGFVIGVNRTVVLKLTTRLVYKILAWLYTILICSINVFTVIKFSDCHSGDILELLEYLFYVLFAIVSGKRLSRYYAELNRFDNQAGCELKVTPASILNLVYSVCNAFIIIVFIILASIFSLRNLILHQIPVHTIHVIELYFYGHLLSLLILRIKSINYYLELSLMNGHDSSYGYITKFIIFKSKSTDKSNYEIKKLMKLYEIIIRAYDRLIDAIKWTLLVILTFAFIMILMFSYAASLDVIHSNNTWLLIISGGGLIVSRMLSFVAPCRLSDQLHKEVRNLRELLAVKLYEDNMVPLTTLIIIRPWLLLKDKLLVKMIQTSPNSMKLCRFIAKFLWPTSSSIIISAPYKQSRGVTRSLIALTNTRDLSFSLLRMLDIDVSLPFKFMALVTTYLIILLQFQKVINP